jgi:hypothetical protein
MNELTSSAKSAKPGKRQILVVVNETVEGAALRDVIKPLSASQPPAEVLVIAPALNSRLRYWLSDEDEARRSAALRLKASLERLGTLGIAADGRVGDADPLQAIADALHEFRAQEILIATHRERHSNWLTRDLVGRARRRFSQPVVHVLDQLTGESETGGRRGRSGRRVAARRVHGANGVSASARNWSQRVPDRPSFDVPSASAAMISR